MYENATCTAASVQVEIPTLAKNNFDFSTGRVVMLTLTLQYSRGDEERVAEERPGWSF